MATLKAWSSGGTKPLEPDGIPLSYLLTTSLEGLENFTLRRHHEAAEIEKEIKRIEKEITAMRLQAQLLRVAALAAEWLGKNREEILGTAPPSAAALEARGTPQKTFEFTDREKIA